MAAGTTPLLMACIKGHRAIVEYLLDHGGKFRGRRDIRAVLYIHDICVHVSLPCVFLLFSHFSLSLSLYIADVKEQDSQGFDCINAACYGGSVDILALLVRKGAVLCRSDSINGMSISLHHNHIYASLKGHHDILNYLFVEDKRDDGSGGKEDDDEGGPPPSLADASVYRRNSFVSFTSGMIKGRSRMMILHEEAKVAKEGLQQKE